MFERMTDRARRSIVLAQEEARMFSHNYIGTEHLLLGLIHEGAGVAAKSLEGLEVSLAAVRSQVDEIVGQGQQPPSGYIPFTPQAKRVLELSLREAQALRHDYIGTEHILLGITRERDGAAARILVRLTGDLETVREAVSAALASRPEADKPGLSSEPSADSSDDRITLAALRAAAAISALPPPQRPEAFVRACRMVVLDMENERGSD